MRQYVSSGGRRTRLRFNGENCDSVCLLKHLQISLLHSNAVHRPVKVELWVRDAVFDQHGEVFCCNQQRMPAGHETTHQASTVLELVTNILTW